MRSLHGDGFHDNDDAGDRHDDADDAIDDEEGARLVLASRTL